MKRLQRIQFWIVLIVVSWLGASHAFATHIQGGEIFYKYLGNDRYEFSIYLFQDCLQGEPGAIAEDMPAKIGIYNGNGVRVFLDSFGHTDVITVPTNFSNACINNPPPTCLRRTYVRFITTLPISSTGYKIVYQRCCRNNSTLNVIDPRAVGATYFATIPPNRTNNSATFTNYPPQIICVNNPLVYDHSATDIDGDSLSYELCEAYQGGNINDIKPIPSFTFPQLPYSPGYSPTHPMDGNPPLQIDAKSGMMTVTPTMSGRYVVTVCCSEWRNGVKINTVRREFQFVVTNCSKAVVANIPQLSNEFNVYIANCKNYTVNFLNTSSGGSTYDWDFGDLSTTADVSNAFQPTYVYPDTGTYVVKLIVNKGSTCSDSIERLVKVYPYFYSDFSYNGVPCPGAEFTFKDSSRNRFEPTTQFEWSFSDGVNQSGIEVKHVFDKGGNYTVTYISGNAMGCRDTMTKVIPIDHFTPFAGADTIIVVGQKINFDAKGGDQYTWTPGTNLSATNIHNPVGTFNDLGKFHYTVRVTSLEGCVGDADINVEVVKEPSMFVPTAFTPNNDGLNDVFRLKSIGYVHIRGIKVFNRYGEIVFQTENKNEAWDGRFKGMDAPMGVYFWMARVTDAFGKEELLKGDVTLIR